MADIIMGQSPGGDSCNHEGNGLPFLQGCGDFGDQHPTTSVYCATPLRSAKSPSVLISVRAPVGTMNVSDQTYCIGRGLAAFTAKPDQADNTFLLHAVEHNLAYLHRRSQGSTFAAVSSADLRSVPIPKIDIDAQQRIAAVFRTVNTTITQTEALIAKYQQIKAGLMHDLFTRGVLPNGQLRPPREQAPHLYKQTELGWVPAEWQVKRCADICSRICVGIVIQPTQYYVEEGVPAFRSANVRESGLDPSNLVYVSPRSNLLLAKSQVKEGDILSVRTGYPGTSAVVPPAYEGANSIDILISTPNAEVTSEYLCDWINSSFGKGQVLRQQGGMAQQHFNVGEMRELLVALPSLAEQALMRGRLKSVGDRLASEHAQAAKLQKQKLGLMQDLLTGKVQVPAQPTA
ncbi:MAG: restriction endonuclease subunit S [Aquabacterium sp.]|nr:restriction endonuclease subunit S [Aquabacterium sp.]